MKLLLDINVIVDVVLEREPWKLDGMRVLAAVETGRAQGYVASHTLTTLYYVVARAKGRQTAISAVADLLRLLKVVPAENADFQQALLLGMGDFEDAVQAAAGLRAGVDYLVTRNEKDFKGGPLDVRSPGEVLPLL